MHECVECYKTFDTIVSSKCYYFQMIDGQITRTERYFCSKECENIYRDRQYKELMDEIANKRCTGHDCCIPCTDSVESCDRIVCDKASMV